MIRPNYRDFKRSQFVVGNGQTIQHSAEGSSWKKHKYIKKVDGTYYYPDSYKGGRHLPDGEKEKSMEDELFEKLKNSSDKDIGQMLRGSFDKILLKQMGVDWTKLPKEEVDRMQRSLIDRLEGKTESNERKDLLDENYEEVQKRVNELVKGSAGSKTIPSDAISVAEDVTKKAIPSRLDENYEEVQKRVNELVKGSAGSKTIPSDAISVAEDVTKKAIPSRLDENYEEVQKRVNELVKGSAGSKTIPSDKIKKRKAISAVRRRLNEIIKGSAGSKTIPSDAIIVDEDVTKKAIPFLLDENYEEVQKRVNELVKGSAGSKTIPSDKTKAISVAEDATKKAVPFLLDENYEEVQRRLNELIKGVPLVDAYRNKKTK